MRFVQLLLILSFSLTLAQSYNDNRAVINTFGEYIKPETNSLDEFEAAGNVKNIKTKEINYRAYNPVTRQDSVINATFAGGLYLEFNQNHKLISQYTLSENDSTQIKESHLYNDAGLEIQKTTYYKDNFEYVEKYVYNKDKLIEVWAKSGYQDNFFLKESLTYNNMNLIVKQENLNNNLEVYPYFKCKGGYPDTDKIYYYSYDKNNRLIQCETYTFEYNAKFMGPPNEEAFVWNSTKKIEYTNGKKKAETIIGYPYPHSKKKYKTNITYTYNNDNNITSYKSVYGPSKKYLDFMQFHYSGKKLDLIETGYGNSINRKAYFRDGKVWKIEEIYPDSRISYKLYDENGQLTKEVSGGETTEYKFESDSKGNWLKLSAFKNGTLISERIRSIEYYD